MAEALTTVRPSEAAQEAEPAWWEMLTLRLPAQLVLSDALLEALSGLNPAWNIERGGCGELVLSMASGGPSGVICSELCGEIRAWAKAVGGGLALESSAGFNVIDPEGGAPMRSPDAAWVSPEQLEASGGLPPASGFWNLCPWFAAEVRSPSDSLAAQQQRMADWLRFGVRLGWLIDPQKPLRLALPARSRSGAAGAPRSAQRRSGPARLPLRLRPDLANARPHRGRRPS